MTSFTPKTKGKEQLSKEEYSAQFSKKVKDYLLINYPTVREKDSIFEITKRLLDSPWTGFPVVDEENNLIGFVSEKDCLKHVLSQKYYHESSNLVSDYMTKDVLTFNPEINILEVMNSFVEHPYHVYPVIDNGHFKGCITRRKALEVMYEFNDSSWNRVS